MNCFFAMFDILGFKNLLEEHKTEGLYSKFHNSLLPMIQSAAMPISKTIERNGKPVMIPDNSFIRANYSFFSDTITYYTNNDSFESFINIHFTALEFLKSGFGTYMPVRGAIGFGDLIADEYGIKIGESIVDSYLGEQSQVWSGCIYTEKAEKLILEKEYMKLFNLLFEDLILREELPHKIQHYNNSKKSLVYYEVPLQKKHSDRGVEYYSEKRLTLDWTKNVFKNASMKVFKGSTSKHQELIKANTISFEEWARKNN